MKPKDIFLAIGVAVTWGLGFVASRLALNDLSPVLMTATRFGIAAVPCFFLRRPNVPWMTLIWISVTLFLAQFLAQAYGIAHNVPVGLTSVVVQSQALFTVAFAALAFSEIPTRVQIIGIAVATLGLLMICLTVGYDFTVGTFAILMISPISFAVGNLLLRRARGAPMFELFSWLSLIAAVPLYALSFATEGFGGVWNSLTHMSLAGAVSIFLLGAVTTSLAYRAWGALLRDYTAAQVVPFALLVPFIGAGASAIVFGETFGPLRLAGMFTVVVGIAVMVLLARPRDVPEIAGGE